MSADLHIHIALNITEDDMKCFYSNHLGSKYFDFDYKCSEKKKSEEIYNKKYAQFKKEFPTPNNQKPFNNKSPDHLRWMELLDEYYKETNHDTCSHENKIENTPNIWVGEVSWLKAALFEDSNTFVPDTIAEISKIIGENLPVIDDEFINKIENALKLFNNTTKDGGVWDGKGYSLGNAQEILDFLISYRGEKCFTISW